MKKILIIMLVAVLCFGCQKKPMIESSSSTQEAPVTEEKSNSVDPAASSELTVEESAKAVEPAVTTVPAVSVAKKPQSSVDFSFLEKINLTDNTSFHADAHKKYLDDKFDFSHYFQISKDNNEDCYLVGSDLCKLYPRELLVFQEDGKAIMNPDFKGDGIPIPLGTILKATGTKKPIKNVNKLYDWFEAFEFEDIMNYFYEVEYNGQNGLIFGADIIVDFGYDKDEFCRDNMAYYADMYLKDGKLDYFTPLEGLNNIPKGKRDYLLQNRIVLQETTPGYISVDDLIDEYSGIDYLVPMFITTDLAAHSQHLMVDRLLQYTEETYFNPRVKDLCEAFIKAIEIQTDVPEDIKNKALFYFKVPELIFRTAPKVEYVKDGWRTEKKYVSAEEDIQNLLFEYPIEVLKDYLQIQNASGEESAVFGTREDFTQYKPRGHYTKNGVLEAYFRASMWFGRIHFAISEDDSEAEKMTPIAMFIVDTVRRNPNLYKKWTEVFDPITALIGESDDLGFPDILPLWSAQNVDNFTKWTEDKANFVSFMKLCQERLKPPAISSNSVFLGFDEKGPITLEKPPMGWRFLGQRYTLDADLFQQVCHPNVQNRTCVRGLDIISILGSSAAESFISMQDYTESTDVTYFAGGKALKEAHETLRSRVDKLDTAYWTKTYYSNILATVRAQATFSQGVGFYFTECPMWNIKSLISSHATWAELKHDTILYAKQSGAEKGGGDDWDISYRTKPFPRPRNYIEPNLSFWKMSLNSIKQLISIYRSFNLMDDETSGILSSLFDMYSRIYDICSKETADIAISDDDNKWIRTIPNLFATYVMIHQDQGDIKEQKDLQMACIADVFTNNDIGECLEVGIGVPYKMYVPLNDCNGKRIAVGFIPSYYEFYQPTSNRLNDDQWKASVYSSSSDLPEKKPFWSKSCILPLEEQ